MLQKMSRFHLMSGGSCRGAEVKFLILNISGQLAPASLWLLLFLEGPYPPKIFPITLLLELVIKAISQASRLL